MTILWQYRKPKLNVGYDSIKPDTPNKQNVVNLTFFINEWLPETLIRWSNVEAYLRDV